MAETNSVAGKRKNYSAEFKAKAALEAIRGDATITELTARHGVHQAVINTWKRQAVDFHPEVTRVFHRELTRLKVMFCGLCWGQDMGGLPFRFGYC